MQVDIFKVKHLILQHQARVVTSKDETDVQHIVVRRRVLYEDALRVFVKPKCDVSKVLRIRFIGESAHDDGGPRREFFRYLIPAIAQSSLFSGWPNPVIPNHLPSAVAANHFFAVGKMLSTCIIQGGQAPLCFVPAVAEYLVKGCVSTKYCLNDIPDYEARQFLEKVSNTVLCIIIIHQGEEC